MPHCVVRRHGDRPSMRHNPEVRISLHSKTRMIRARASTLPFPTTGWVIGCCPFERPLGMGGSQSAEWSAEDADLSATRGKRNVCAGWRSRSDTTLTRPYNGASRTGQLLEKFERQRASGFAGYSRRISADLVGVDVRGRGKMRHETRALPRYATALPSEFAASGHRSLSTTLPSPCADGLGRPGHQRGGSRRLWAPAF